MALFDRTNDTIIPLPYFLPIIPVLFKAIKTNVPWYYRDLFQRLS